MSVFLKNDHKNLGTTSNLTTVVLTQNSECQCAKFDPKTCSMSRVCYNIISYIYWKIRHGILISKFSYLNIGEYQKHRCLKISDFFKSKLSYLTIHVGEYRNGRCLEISDFEIQVLVHVLPYQQIQLPALSSFFNILFISFSVSPWCWKLALPAFGRFLVTHA